MNLSTISLLYSSYNQIEFSKEGIIFRRGPKNIYSPEDKNISVIFLLCLDRIFLRTEYYPREVLKYDHLPEDKKKMTISLLYSPYKSICNFSVIFPLQPDRIF